MATQHGQKAIHALIIDTGPLIKNTVSISTILAQAEEIYTTPAVLSEIRDPATRARVETSLLPFLKVRSPTPASYDAVAAFSKKTGDFPVLSRQDLGILALAYEIHCQKHGGDVGLRRAPGGEIMKGSEIKNEEAKGADGVEEAKEGAMIAPADVVEGVGKSEDFISNSMASNAHEASANTPKMAEITTDIEIESTREPTLSLEEDISKLQVSESNIQEAIQPAFQDISELNSQALPDCNAQTVVQLNFQNEAQIPSGEVTEPTLQEETSPISSDGDDSDGEWITPTNLAQHQAKDSGVSSRTSAEKQMDIATMTTDFAMQNVLLQMNLNLLSTNLQRISTLRTYILRCHACFLTTKEVTKQFCPRCGQPTLNRVSCTTTSTGEFKIHLAKNYQHNNRGNRYSVPKPVGGTASGKMNGKGGGKGGWGRDLVLAEDQKEYLKHAEQEKRIKTRDLMDEDYLPGILTGDRGRAGGRMKVGAGKNVNSRKKF